MTHRLRDSQVESFFYTCRPLMQKNLLQDVFHFNQQFKNWFSKQEIGLSKQEMELFLPHPHLRSKNFQYKMLPRCGSTSTLTESWDSMNFLFSTHQQPNHPPPQEKPKITWKAQLYLQQQLSRKLRGMRWCSKEILLFLQDSRKGSVCHLFCLKYRCCQAQFSSSWLVQSNWA